MVTALHRCKSAVLRYPGYVVLRFDAEILINKNHRDMVKTLGNPSGIVSSASLSYDTLFFFFWV